MYVLYWPGIVARDGEKEESDERGEERYQ